MNNLVRIVRTVKIWKNTQPTKEQMLRREHDCLEGEIFEYIKREIAIKRANRLKTPGTYGSEKNAFYQFCTHMDRY